MEDEKVYYLEEKIKKTRRFQVFFFILFLIVFSFLIGAYIVLYSEYSMQQIKLDRLEWVMYRDSRARIDLTETSFQNLSDGFKIAVKNVDTHLTGIKIKGSILNTQSVNYENARFTIELASTSKDFVVNKIPQGYASDFEIYILHSLVTIMLL